MNWEAFLINNVSINNKRAGFDNRSPHRRHLHRLITGHWYRTFVNILNRTVMAIVRQKEAFYFEIKSDFIRHENHEHLIDEMGATGFGIYMYTLMLLCGKETITVSRLVSKLKRELGASEEDVLRTLELSDDLYTDDEGLHSLFNTQNNEKVENGKETSSKGGNTYALNKWFKNPDTSNWKKINEKLIEMGKNPDYIEHVYEGLKSGEIKEFNDIKR